METKIENFEAALERFIKNVTAYRKAHYEKGLPGSTEEGGLWASEYPVEAAPGGRRFVKLVVRMKYGGGHVYCFVERATGKVFKAASYKAPALPHARGSIYATEWAGYGVSEYGAEYIKGGMGKRAPLPAPFEAPVAAKVEKNERAATHERADGSRMALGAAIEMAANVYANKLADELAKLGPELAALVVKKLAGHVAADGKAAA